MLVGGGSELGVLCSLLWGGGSVRKQQICILTCPLLVHQSTSLSDMKAEVKPAPQEPVSVIPLTQVDVVQAKLATFPKADWCLVPGVMRAVSELGGPADPNLNLPFFLTTQLGVWLVLVFDFQL